MKKIHLISRLYLLLFLLFSCSKNKVDAHEKEIRKKAVEKGFHIVGYMFSSGNLDIESAKLNFDKITHLNVAFINPEANGAFAPVTGLTEAVKRAHDNGVKVYSSFAGGNPPGHLKELLKADKRGDLVNALVNLTTTYNLDGIDVDLEGDYIDDNYEPFITELHAALEQKGKEITAAVATWNGNTISDKALSLFDMVHIMSYDQTGPWNLERPGPHSTYEAAVADFTYWNVTRSVPASKLTLGVPFYGYGFGNDIRSDMSFGDIVSTYPNSENTDSVTVSEKGVIYYNGIPTIKRKVELAIDKKAAGIMIWQLLGDATEDKSLLSVINNTIP
ncbi:glycosyl hydrolase family 18 protein [Pseudopedobacter beijingensis]|uniref:chitinase n=1 Tax=Pseudopedobacter beijingensis TaxID=1207056 RepID=A0ABW4IHP0_9SPHI